MDFVFEKEKRTKKYKKLSEKILMPIPSSQIDFLCHRTEKVSVRCWLRNHYVSDFFNVRN